MTKLTITNDVWITRGHARAAARLLRTNGFDARVETSGPAGAREYRVRVGHPKYGNCLLRRG